MIGDQRFDVAFDDAASDVPGPRGAVDGEFVVLAHVDECEGLAAIQSGLDLRGRARANRPLGRVHQRQESRVMLHGPIRLPMGQRDYQMTQRWVFAAKARPPRVTAKATETD